MPWNDIACIVFACVTAVHLGLISAIERVTGWGLSVFNCPKCLTFWSVLAYCSVCCNSVATIPSIFAVSFLCSYIALWLELLQAFIDTLYIRLYDKIYPASYNKAPTDPECGNSAGSMPELQQENKV